ncbi:tetratricopeptide repeat protein [Pseudoduganella umbonata]|uniref:MSHA biogenesis protein MshN n=1 Tax=Pseudoduganella umbonata TaxID=864828 RepID=A0A4P8HMY5_9BURK|nr:tetratricopeptide repeat protein [Pseudoduganella umbonata]MBB3219670.1 MSHA biogenesis protein MshN [Pseudoduganella umbonata]QCP09728.1 tetratricopeptide repeat protein [Pseudoduganella umbonata]
MSLINKMLQDLDARGGTARPAASGDVRPVAAGRTSRAAIAVGAGVGVLIAAAGAGGWYWLNREPAAPAPVVAAVPAMAAPAPAVPAPVVLAPAVPTAPAEPVAALAAPVPEPAPPGAPRPQPVPAPVAEASPPPRADSAAIAAAPRTTQKERLARLASGERDRIAAAASSAPVRAAGSQAGQGITLTAGQQGENAYRRALAALQDGRVTEGVAALEQAVQAWPRHEAARQTLVGLLIENGRADEAMRHAQLGLGLDANQPQLAMVLARLQLERGGPADQTLLRTLPHAAGNADYLAFLAGVLQRQGRHREAAQQYEAALRLRPNNGVWWMGLGISQQAENQRTNAREAFQKAREAGLSPELQAFVERRLGQLN